MATMHGQVLSVTRVVAGSNLNADVAIGATVLPVEDAADFDEAGGTLALNGTTLAYASADLTADTLTLAAPLAVSAAMGDLVIRWDTNTGAQASTLVASVAVDGADANSDPVQAVVTHALQPLLAEGIRSTDGESVTLTLNGGTWFVTEIIGRTPWLQAVNSSGDVTFSVDPETGNVVLAGNIATGFDGQPRVEITDWFIQNNDGDYSQGVAQVRLIPGEDVVTTGWDTTKPSVITHWSKTVNGADGFGLDIRTATPSGGLMPGAIILASDTTGTDKAAAHLYGAFQIIAADSSRVYQEVEANKNVWWGDGDARIANFASNVDLVTNANVGPGSAYHARFHGDSNYVTAGYDDYAGDIHGLNVAAAGTVRLQTLASSPGVEVLNASGSSYQSIKASAFTVSSDRAAKQNIHAPTQSALDILRNAPVYGYDYKPEVATDGANRIGPMADDLPDNIAATATGGVWAGLGQLDLVQLVGTLMQAIQELDAEMDNYRKGPKPTRKVRDFTDKPLPPQAKHPPGSKPPKDRPDPPNWKAKK